MRRRRRVVHSLCIGSEDCKFREIRRVSRYIKRKLPVCNFKDECSLKLIVTSYELGFWGFNHLKSVGLGLFPTESGKQ